MNSGGNCEFEQIFQIYYGSTITFYLRQPQDFSWSCAEPPQKPSTASLVHRPTLRRWSDVCLPSPPCLRQWNAKRWRLFHWTGLWWPGTIWPTTFANLEHSWPRARHVQPESEQVLCWIRCPEKRKSKNFRLAFNYQHFYIVCHGYRLTWRDDYFWITFDHFCSKLHFLRQRKLGRSYNPGVAKVQPAKTFCPARGASF